MVRGTVVDKHNFKIAVALGQDAGYGVRQILSLIETRHDHRNKRLWQVIGLFVVVQLGPIHKLSLSSLCTASFMVGDVFSVPLRLVPKENCVAMGMPSF
jgi:hypothetical protein